MIRLIGADSSARCPIRQLDSTPHSFEMELVKCHGAWVVGFNRNLSEPVAGCGRDARGPSERDAHKFKLTYYPLPGTDALSAMHR
jgi:hypothetical protein